jgi:hypothetical protein
MTLAIMQPYFFPYLGYFQLIHEADRFVIYDNIEFTKKGWINRNRILGRNEPDVISLPLRKDSDYLDICERSLADVWPMERKKMLNKIRAMYNKAPEYNAVFPLVEGILSSPETNLFLFLKSSLETICGYLDMDTSFVVSSGVPIDHTLKAADKVIGICKALGADRYVNPIGGVELYSRERFEEEGIELAFIRMNELVYPQGKQAFQPSLSIIDVMMFNSKEQVKNYISGAYSLL